MRWLLVSLPLVALGCARTADDGDLPDGASDPLLLVPPDAVEPEWAADPRLLRDTWLGYPLAGTHTWETTLTVSSVATGVDGAPRTFEETRAYASDLGREVSSLRIEGDRFEEPLDAWLGLTEQGWVAQWDNVQQQWRLLWPLDIVEGNHWTGPITWFRRDVFQFSQYDGRWEVVGVDVASPDGVQGCVHLRSSFTSDVGHEGEWDVWYADGPVYEERSLRRPYPDNTLEHGISVRVRTR